jgi:leader peptidase (prepilin peptidase) / N-methyltransferase
MDHHRLPDAIVLPLYPLGIAGLVLAGLVAGHWPLVEVAVGVAAWLVVIGGIWLFTGGRAMGFGDVKLAPVLAATLAWVGISSALVGLLVAFVLGGLVGMVLMLSGRARRGSHLAFGPFLLLGALVGLLWGESLGSAYLDILGL